MQRTLCDLGRPIAGLDQDIPALGAECGGHRLCKSLDTSKQRCPGIHAKLQILSGECQPCTIDPSGGAITNLVRESELLCRPDPARRREGRGDRRSCQGALHGCGFILRKGGRETVRRK